MLKRSLLLLVVALPVASAQALDVEAGAMDVVKPLQGPGVSTLRVGGVCPENATLAVLSLAVERAPAWATAKLSPETVTVEACPGGRFQREATLSVIVTDLAPAFSPAPVVVRARLEGWGEPRGGTAGVDVTADYFSILQVDLGESVAEVAPGAVAEFPLRIENRGNGPTRVEVFASDATGHLSPAPVETFVLGSGPHGDATGRDLVLRVATEAERGLVNRVGVVNWVLRATHAERPELHGDESHVSVIVQTKSDIPAGALAPLALAVAALVARRLNAGR